MLLYISPQIFYEAEESQIKLLREQYQKPSAYTTESHHLTDCTITSSRSLCGWLLAQSYLTFTVSYLLLTYLLIAWSRVLLEKLTGFQLVKKCPAFNGTRRFITAFTRAQHLSLTWVSLIQSMPPHPTSWKSILILSSHLHLGLPSGVFLFLISTYTKLCLLSWFSRW